jgi:hypothetical protein
MPFDPMHMIDIDDGRLVSSRSDLERACTSAREKGLPIGCYILSRRLTEDQDDYR